ncbi:MAG: xanthine dehydrogenase family protein subunit M [Vicinamibacterales bacterium]
MYSPSFAYHRASSVADALKLVAANPGARVLAGGHSLLPLLKLRLAAPSALIDIGRIGELKGISAAAGGVRIGALTTHAEIAAADLVRRQCAVLAEAAGQIGDPAVRNRGTIGGSVAHADPAADLPTVLVALGATIDVAGPGGTRTIAAVDFFQGMMATALADGELVTAVTVPALAKGTGAAYVKFAHPASRYAVVGAAAVVGVQGGKCSAASVAVGGLVPVPTRLAAVEAALTGTALDAAAIDAAAARTAGALGGDVLGDLFASADYRTAVAGTYVARAVAAAAARV